MKLVKYVLGKMVQTHLNKFIFQKKKKTPLPTNTPCPSPFTNLPLKKNLFSKKQKQKNYPSPGHPDSPPRPPSTNLPLKLFCFPKIKFIHSPRAPPTLHPPSLPTYPPPPSPTYPPTNLPYTPPHLPTLHPFSTNLLLNFFLFSKNNRNLYFRRKKINTTPCLPLDVYSHVN